MKVLETVVGIVQKKQKELYTNNLKMDTITEIRVWEVRSELGFRARGVKTDVRPTG